MAEKLRQFVTVQLESIDVPASLAIEAVFAAQNRPAVLERPDTRPSGVGDIREGLGQGPRRQAVFRIEQARIRCQARKGSALPGDHGLAFEQ